MDTQVSEQYVYDLETALGNLLDYFEPGFGADPYTIDNDGHLFVISNEMASVVDRANEVLYGEGWED